MSAERSTETGGSLQAELGELLAKADIPALREYLNRVQVDKLVFDEIEALKGDIEENYEGIVESEELREEIVELDPDSFKKALDKLKPFIEALPAAHGKGHLHRDIINACLILNDPNFEDTEFEGEIVAGIFAAAFHDIGNSVVGRYDDPKRFAAHAEVGAYIASKLLKDILPPNLLLLVQYSIAAHTHYLRDITVTRGDITVTRKPYRDVTIANEIYAAEPLLAVWLARWADRLDILGANGVIRHIITKNVPTADFDGESYHNVWEDEKDDFRYQFYPELRSDGELARLKGIFPAKHPETTRRVLETLDIYARSQFDSSLPYSRYDTPYYRASLMAEAALDTIWFTQAVLAKQNLGKAEVDKMIEHFASYCILIEPAEDIHEVNARLATKFALLTVRERAAWANGFIELTKGHKRWFERTEKLLKVESDNSFGPNVQKLVENLRRIAYQKLHDFSPFWVEMAG